MPRANIFIRNEDLEKWKAIEKKSEFIHNALNPAPYAAPGTAYGIGVDICKIHGIPLDSRGRCLQKGCKYA